MAWIFFNLILIIMIAAFGQDSISIGSYSTGSINIDGNTSTNDDISLSKGTGFIDSFRTGITGLPWWLNLVFVVVEFSFLGLIIYALIRGL